MKIVRQFRKKGDGDLKVTYHEDISKAATNPVFVGRIACEKKTLEQMFGHVPEVFIMEIEEGIITDLW